MLKLQAFSMEVCMQFSNIPHRNELLSICI
jgi:hypothetical protein